MSRSVTKISYAQSVLMVTSLFQWVSETQAINVHGIEPVNNIEIGFFQSSTHQLKPRTPTIESSSKDYTIFALMMGFLACAIASFSITAACAYYCRKKERESDDGLSIRAVP